MQRVDRLTADLGLDNALANRANTLAATARQAGQPPAPQQIQALTEDSLDGLRDAGDQLEQAADHIGKQLDTMNLPRQQRAWGQAIDDMKKARTKIHYPTRQELTAGSTSAMGIGPKVMYEATDSYQGAVESLTSIADQSGFVELGQKNWIAQGRPDTQPPPNPGPDPWQEWLRRMQAQAARIRNNINGLNAARALQAGQFQQALQNASAMRQAINDSMNAANQLSQLAALCNQAAANQQQAQGRQPTQSPAGSAASGGGSAPAAATGGGGGGAALLGVLVAGGAAAGGYAYYKSQQCPVPPETSDYTACSRGSCSACVRMSQEVATYCDCFERKGQTPSGDYCGQLRAAIDNLARACMAPVSYSPVPGAAISRR